MSDNYFFSDEYMTFKDASRLIYDWNSIDSSEVNKPGKILICDETLRDGLQNASATDPTLSQKIEILHLMEDLGISCLNLGIAGSSKKIAADVEGLAREISEKELKIKPNCPARLFKSDVQTYIDISSRTEVTLELAVFIASSPIRFLVEGWHLEKILKRVRETITFAVDNDFPVMFVTEDTTRASPETITTLLSEAINAGANRICLCDTAGHATPKGTKRIISFVKELISDMGSNDVEIDWHGHRDRGLSLINALTALESGATRVHATALGLGERSGNLPMEQLLVNLYLLEWINNDLSSLMTYSKKVSEYCKVPIPFNQPIVGRDAFRTSTGIHASAILKAKKMGNDWLADRVYSSVPAGLIGRHQEVEIGPGSGKSNVLFWLMQRGFSYDKALVDEILKFAKSRQRILNESEILAIIAKKI